MRRARPALATLGVVVMIVLSSTSAPRAASQDEGWEFLVAPYIWAAGIEGQVVTEDFTVPLDESFFDLVETLSAGGFLHFEGRCGAWGFLADGVYIKLDDESESPNVGEFETEETTSFVEAAGFRRFGGQQTSFDLIFGARWSRFNVEIEIVDAFNPVLQGADTEADHSWVDAMIGGRFNLKLGESWDAATRLDFAAGGSDFTWNVSTVVQWHMSPHTALGFGFRILDIDFKDDAEDLEFKPQLAGLTIGMGFKIP